MLRWFSIIGAFMAGAMFGMTMSRASAQTEPPVVAGDPGTVCVDLSWTAPTENEDGSPLTDLTAYRIYLGIESGDYLDVILLDDPALVAYRLCGLTPEARYFIAMTAWNSGGQESAFSNELPITTDALTIGPDLTAYSLEKTSGRITLVPIGHVDPGTECDSTQMVRDFNGITAYVVPKASVEFAGGDTEVPFAKCF